MDNILDTMFDTMFDHILCLFNHYRISHPNLSECWMSYLELKKRHYDVFDILQCKKVLTLIENGYPDLNRNDMVRLLLYNHSCSINNI